MLRNQESQGGDHAQANVCLSADLRQYLELFRPCFSRRQWKYFVIVLLGLLECDERKTLTGLRQVVAEQCSLSGLSRFLSKWPWQPEQFREGYSAEHLFPQLALSDS